MKKPKGMYKCRNYDYDSSAANQAKNLRVYNRNIHQKKKIRTGCKIDSEKREKYSSAVYHIFALKL